LYAKYGQPEKAETLFKQILAKKAYLPALLNIGHLCFIRNDFNGALGYYQQASAIDPKNPHALLSIAKADQELKNYDDMKQKYDQLRELDPTLATQYAYLSTASDTGSRATDIGTERRRVLWENE
jgi:tetratricopeptide (TPR) repeat protein